MGRVQFTVCVLLFALVNFSPASAQERAERLSPPRKQGSCPPVSWFGVSGYCHLLPPYRYCSSDYQCPGNERCCFNGCGSMCVDPIIGDKPGVCPAPSFFGNVSRCAAITQFRCNGDYDCYRNLKCCDNGCGFTCVDPYVVKPGQCPPRISGPYCPYVYRPPCSGDSQCRGLQKCCNDGCGPTCVDPYVAPPKEKPGVCPAPPARALSIAPCRDSCTYDVQCPNVEKCCQGSCGRVCVPPYREKPGNCPPKSWFGDPNRCPRIFQIPCSSDSQCNGRFKCCDNGCGPTCVDPFMAPPTKPNCPVVPRYGSLARCGNWCYSHNDCPATLKCCPSGCGYACLPPPNEEKPGVCPRPGNFGTCVEQCAADKDCPRRLKCCSNGCGRTCMRPY